MQTLRVITYSGIPQSSKRGGHGLNNPQTGAAPWRGGEGRGAKAPIKISKKGKIKNMGYFHASKLLKLAFLLSLTSNNMLWKGFYHDFSTNKASASGASPSDPHQGALPPGPPRIPCPPLTIYPGAAPAPQKLLKIQKWGSFFANVHLWPHVPV